MLDVVTDWDDLDGAFDALEAECTDIVRGITLVAWNRTLEQTPQFYGRLVASWTYSLDMPVFTDNSHLIDTEAVAQRYGHANDEGEPEFDGLRKGHPDAIAIANSINARVPAQFRLGDTVWFANGADHDEGPYAGEKEAGERLRPANRPGHMAQRALDWVQARYGVDIIPARALVLKQTRMGG